jgi:hypothetical protein
VRVVHPIQARAETLREWKRQLTAAAESEGPGRMVADAILPCFEKWMSRGRLEVSFRVTQMLSGHGCFGEYLCRIGKERTTRCHHCAAGCDTAYHTLAHCTICTRWRIAQHGRKNIVS